jgi:transforming growth factor-beta-induced protein
VSRESTILLTNNRFGIPFLQAFAKLGQTRIAALLKNPTALSDILFYHIRNGRVLKKDMKTGVINAANNDNVLYRVRPSGGVVINNKANVTEFNITAENGIIHLIDTVLLPPKNLIDTILTDSRFSTLGAAVKAAGLVNTLKDVKNDLTIFAPTNKAFDALGTTAIQALLREQKTLKTILLHHVVDGSVLKSDLKKLGTSGNVTTVQGSKLQFNFTGDALDVGNAKVIEAGILAANGIIHVINKVLIPK